MHNSGQPEELNAFARFWVDVWRCVRRVFAGNFQTVRVTPREAAKLAYSSSPITEPVGQSYAAWRRSALWIAAVALFVHVVIQLSTFRFQESLIRRSVAKASTEQITAGRKLLRENPQAAMQLAAMDPDLYGVSKGTMSRERYIERKTDAQVTLWGKSNLELIDALTIIGLLISAASVVMVNLSAIFWSRLPLSRLFVLIGWGILFATPVVLAMLPLSKMMDFSHVKNDSVRKGVILGLGALFAVGVFVTEGVKVLAVFPGIIRSSMGLKTLLPESAAPGWVVALIAPIYALVLLLFLVTANQLQGSWKLVTAAFLLLLAPVIYLIFNKAIVRPHDAKEISSVVIPIRLGVAAVNAAGLVFLALWLLKDLPFFGIGDVFKFIFGLIANVLLLTVVVTDIAIRMLRAGYIQTQGFQESRLREKLDYRFAALAQIGRRRGAASEPAPDIPGRTAGEPVFDDPTPFGRAVRAKDDSLVFEDPPRRNDDSLVIE